MATEMALPVGPGQPPEASEGGNHSAAPPPRSVPVTVIVAGPSLATTLTRYCMECEEDQPMTVVGNDDHLWLRCPGCHEFSRLEIADGPAL